ncbi:hypothetical protein H8B06_11925 [Sphingobacterium sp. DN00404]|uniref:Uncharacterized protein n=1 Tax=Sphingobacterium micropteri TaxID=2763501 RepID=A0ABR7YQB7_9SPHI|nr:hypothetical protein [Sphingobacterium micropteri]MBD1433539.1 hypothetical protein [Sphingobacterium micropteri]
MSTINKKRPVTILKRFSAIAIILSVATFTQIYWAMGQFSDLMSSADLERGFIEDALYMSLLTGLLLGTLFFFIVRIRNRYIKYALQWVLLAAIWFFWNDTIFVEREASWSTYLFHEEMYYVTYLSFFPITILSTLTLLAINYNIFSSLTGLPK